MAFDLILRNARIAGAAAQAPLNDIGIRGGSIAAIEPQLAADGAERDVGGLFVSPGLIETHIHLDKSRIMDRCSAAPDRGTDHMARVAAVKPGFTQEDVYHRAQATVEQCLVNGASHMRTHVELDPNVGLRGFEALRQLAADYRWAIDIEICVFAQEGWTNAPETDRNIVAALKNGAAVVGGAPGYDPDHGGQIRRIFELAREFDVDVDIHLDVGHTIDDMDIHLVCELTETFGWGGRVAVGHGTKYSCLPPAQLRDLGARLADTGVAVTVLPATDLFVMGRHLDHGVIRGVADANALLACGVNCSLSTNNVLNPFTPFGDCSLVRIANLYANVAQRGGEDELVDIFEMLTHRSARLLRRDDYGIAPGKPADLVVWNAQSGAEAVATIARPLYGFKRGRQSFSQSLPELHRP
ncbi:MAG: amidohydrolase family protein [Proteobacteria bacterium]|nr:amidohydrolase family protein [Pseudomonadota bacterium]